MNRCDEEAAFHDAMGELHGPAHRAFVEHLRECAQCRDEREQWVDFLASVRREDSSKTLTREQGGVFSRVAGIAAAFLLAFGVILLVQGTPARQQNPDQEKLTQRLLDSQGEDGSWAGDVGVTAFATLALLENGAVPRHASERAHIENAIHFLTRPTRASGEEEWIRALALLRDPERSRGSANPQLQRALDHALRQSNAFSPEIAAPVLREISTQARRLGLDCTLVDRRLGALVATSKEPIPQDTDWDSVTRAIPAGRVREQIAAPSLQLAASLMRVASMR